MFGFHQHIIHIGRAGAHILRRDVLAAERFDETAMRAKNRFAISALVVADNDGFAAAEGKIGERVLVSHAAREAENVGKRAVFTLVIPEPRAPDGGAQGGAVKRNDTAVSHGAIRAKEDTLETRYGSFLDLHEKDYDTARPA